MDTLINQIHISLTNYFGNSEIRRESGKQKEKEREERRKSRQERGEEEKTKKIYGS